MKKVSVVILICILFLSSIIPIFALSSSQPHEVRLMIDGPIAVSKANMRAGGVIKQNAHGGSWLDSFENDSGIDWGSSDNLKLISGILQLNTTSPIDPDLVGYWPLDEGAGTTAPDESIYGNDGSINSAAWTTGKFGNALSFDGIDDYVNFGNDSSLNITKSFTLSAWIKVNSFKGQMIFQKGVNQFYQHTNSKVQGIIRAGTTDAVVTINNPLTIGNWYQIAYVYEDSGDRKINIFINGFESSYFSEVAAVGTLNNYSSENLNIGYDSNIGWYFDGAIDEVACFKKALSSTDVKNLYDNRIVFGKVRRGNLTSSAIAIPENKFWDTLLIKKTQPAGTFLNVSILNASDDQKIPGTSTYITGGEFDISYIDAIKYPTIKLYATFEGNGISTPSLEYFGVSWNASNAWRDTFFDGMKVDSYTKIEGIDGNAQLESTGIDLTAVAFLHFDESSGSTTNDETANNNDGTITGALWTGGRFNGALDFDGVDDNVKVFDSPSLYLPGGFSISFWMKDSGSSSFTSFISKKTVSFTGNEWTFIGNANTPHTRFAIYDNSQSSYIGREDSSLNIFDGNWHHVVGTWDGGTTSAGIKIYVDGVGVDDTNLQTGTFFGMEDKSTNILIADTLESGINNFNGIIDEVGIFGRVLTLQEITNLNQNNRDFYIHRGNVISKPILIPDAHYWDAMQTSNEGVTNTFINVTILDAGTDNAIPGFMNLTGSTIDISSLDPQIYPSIRLQATFGSDGDNSPVLHDWSVNWTININKAPSSLSLSPTNTELYRTDTTSLEINAFDHETGENSLTIDVEQKHEDSSTWQKVFLSNLRYGADSWFIDFTPVSTAELGMYDFRVTCNDDFDESLMMIYNDVIEVKNNLPGPPTIEIKPVTPKTTDDLTVIASEAKDVENEPVTYYYQWYKNNVPQENLTGTIISFSYTTKGDAWRCDVTPNDGNPGANGTINSTSVVILNTPPVVSKEIESVEFNEDEIDDSSIDLFNFFADADDDLLIYEFTGHDKIDVTVGSSGSNVILTPDENWFGTEYITITANDTESEVSTTVKIDVRPQNDQPRLIKAGIIEVKSTETKLAYSVYQDRWLNIPLTAEDIDGDTLVFSTNRTDNVGLDDIDPELMKFEANELMFKPDNSHVGSFSLNLSLSDMNGSVVYYEMVIEVLNTNDPPTVIITYPSNGTTFKEDDLIDLTCALWDLDLEIPEPDEELTVSWTTNRSTKELGSGRMLTNLTGLKLVPGYHKITVTVEDMDGSSNKDEVYIYIEKGKEETPSTTLSEVSSNYWWTFVIIVVIIVLVIIVAFVFKRRKSAEKAEVEYIPKGEAMAVSAKTIVKPGAIAPPTIDMEQVGAPAQAAQLPPGSAVEVVEGAGVSVPEPVTFEPKRLPGMQQPGAPVDRTDADILGIKMDAGAYDKNEVMAEPAKPEQEEQELAKVDLTGTDTSAYTLEGGPRASEKEAVEHDIEDRVVEAVDTDSAVAYLAGAKVVRATEEATVMHEGDKSVWRPDVRGKTAASREVLEQIEKLGELKMKGLITEEEFKRKKEELLK